MERERILGKMEASIQEIFWKKSAMGKEKWISQTDSNTLEASMRIDSWEMASLSIQKEMYTKETFQMDQEVERESGGSRRILIKNRKNGEFYEGEWDKDKINGTGTYTYSDKSTYTGGFEIGKKKGQGVLTKQHKLITSQVKWGQV